MSSRPLLWLAVPAALVAAVIYAGRLDVSPVYLSHDEVIYARQAYAIATTGRDLNGDLLAVSIPIVGNFYATPASINLTAAFLTVLPLSEITVRLPSVLVGLICAALCYLIARRVFDSAPAGALAAAILLLTPAHFIHSRLGTDHLYVVACVLAWMATLIHGTPGDRTRVFAATAFLGVSLYTYLGALITAPLCVAITLAWLALIGARAWRPYAAALAGFVLPAAPFVAWHLTHPRQYAEQIRMYALYDSRTLDAVQGAKTLAGATSMTERAGVYWDYFNPSFLFFAGDTGLLNGTRFTGVFLLPMLVLVPAGLIAVLRTRGSARILLATVFAAAPVAAVVVAERYRINRALVMLPVASIVSVAALQWMWESRRVVLRSTAVALVALMPLQFAGFYRDYFGDYRIRSYPWFEYNMRGGMEAIISRAGDDRPVWISQSLQWADHYWPFYLERHGRRALSLQTHYIDAERHDLATIGGGFVLCRAAEEQRFLDAGFTRVAEVREPDRTHSLSVLQR